MITVEGDFHHVSCADDGSWLARPTIFPPNRPVRDLNIVIDTGGMELQIKILEGELDLLIRCDLQVPGLIM